eukprot:s1880_g18.t1
MIRLRTVEQEAVVAQASTFSEVAREGTSAEVVQESTSSEVAKESKSVDQGDWTRWRRCEKAGKVGVQDFLAQSRLDVCETGPFWVALPPMSDVECLWTYPWITAQTTFPLAFYQSTENAKPDRSHRFHSYVRQVLHAWFVRQLPDLDRRQRELAALLQEDMPVVNLRSTSAAHANTIGLVHVLKTNSFLKIGSTSACVGERNRPQPLQNGWLSTNCSCW